MQSYSKNWIKFFIVFTVCVLFRLMPFRAPNVEPILASTMPFAKSYGPVLGFFFGFFSIIFYDLITSTLGPWSFFTSLTYGFIGCGAFFFFKHRPSRSIEYAKFAIIGTLVFDAVTGLSVGPLFFNQSLEAAFVGQIPFTMWHLLGNVSFALVLSPAIHRYIIKNEKLEPRSLIRILNPKKI